MSGLEPPPGWIGDSDDDWIKPGAHESVVYVFKPHPVHRPEQNGKWELGVADRAPEYFDTAEQAMWHAELEGYV